MSGNPTKSQSVNYLILGVKRFEVRGQGVTSCVQRPFEWEEFVSLFVLCCIMFATSPLMVNMVGILSARWQLIWRIDYVMELKKSAVSFNL